MKATQNFTILGNICNPGNKNYKILRKETEEDATIWKTAFERTLYMNIAIPSAAHGPWNTYHEPLSLIFCIPPCHSDLSLTEIVMF